MAFWIALAVIVIVIVIGIIYAVREGYFEAFFPTAGITVVLALVSLIIIGPGAEASATRTTELESTYTLRALVTKDSTESSGSAVFFLGFGYAEGGSATVTSISYIQTAADGGNTLEKVGISDAVIYEDLLPGETPYVEEWVEHFETTGAWLPWTVEGVSRFAPTVYRFHIPDGSIYEGYEVNP